MSTSISAPDSRLAVRYTPTELDTETLGEIFVKSGFFKDTRDKAQAIVKILAGRELDFGPIASMQGVYLVNGRVSLSANLVGAAIKRSARYDYRVVKLDHTECHLKFFEQGQQIGDSTFTLDDAKKAGLTGSETYTKYVRNMLFSRALTNGARWYCPDVFNGPIYTPDELGAQVDLETGEVLEFVPLRDQAPEEGPRDRTGKLLERYGRLLSDVRNAGAITEAELQDYILPAGASDAYITAKGKQLADKLAMARASGDNQSPRSAPRGGDAPPPARPADLERSRLWAERRQQEIKGGELGVPVRTLNSRLATDELTAEIELTRAQIKSVEEDLVAEPEEQESLV